VGPRDRVLEFLLLLQWSKEKSEKQEGTSGKYLFQKNLKTIRHEQKIRISLTRFKLDDSKPFLGLSSPTVFLL